MFLAFVLLIAQAPFLFAETGSEGAVAEVTADTELLKEPEEGAKSFGLLPKGTLLRILGPQEGRYYSVEVELEQGLLEGWVLQDKLGFGEAERDAPLTKPKKAAGLRAEKPSDELKPRLVKKARVPKDEGLLLRRAPSFFYGLQASGLIGYVRAIDGTSFVGPGFSAGAHLGTYAAREFPLRLEVGYTMITGTAPTGYQVNFGFLEGGGSAGYEFFDGFEAFAKVHYALALSVSNLGALNSTFSTVSQLSSIWLGGGAGYKFTISEVTHINVRALYSISLLGSPFNFQAFGLQVMLDLQG